jgi:hypothetical protein
MPRTIRASFYDGARWFTTGTAPMPSPGPDEALAQSQGAGLDARRGPLAAAD